MQAPAPKNDPIPMWERVAMLTVAAGVAAFLVLRLAFLLAVVAAVWRL